MHRSDSPTPSYDFRGDEDYDQRKKSILRSPTSPKLSKSRKVRFAEMGEVAQQAAAAEGHGKETPSPSGYSQSPLHPSSGMAYDPNQGQYSPTAAPGSAYPYCYYYNPYAYPQQYQQQQYTQQQYPQQGWSMMPANPAHLPPNHAAPSNVSAPSASEAGIGGGQMPPGGSGTLPGAPGHDPKRMHLLAKSVSITVNQGQQMEPTMPPGMQHVQNPGNPNLKEPPGSVSEEVAAAMKKEQIWEERALRQAFKWLSRACMLRVFKAWQHLCVERWWKTQITLRDQQLQVLSSQMRHLEWRPVRYIKRYRMKLWLSAWIVFCARKQAKRGAMLRAAQHSNDSLLDRAIRAWSIETQNERTNTVAEQRAAKLHTRRRRLHILAAWRSLVGRRARKQAMERTARSMRSTRLLHNAFGSWAYLARYYATERAAVKWRRRGAAIAALSAWRYLTAEKKENAQLVAAFRAQHAASICSWAFLGWRAFADGHLAYSIAEEATRLREETRQLREDNQRLSRVIDSGEWGRGRVAELAEAGKVLQQERDALVKLVESLPGARGRRGSRLSVVQQAKAGPEHAAPTSEIPARRSSLPPNSLPVSRKSSFVESSAMNEASIPTHIPPSKIAPTISSVLEAGSAASKTRAPVDSSARNKMTVRTGSSFNALVRALKQDLLATGAFSRDPEAAFVVDNLSMQQVHCTGEGLKIEAVGTAVGREGYSFPKADGARGAGHNEHTAAAPSPTVSVGGRSVALSTTAARRD